MEILQEIDNKKTLDAIENQLRLYRTYTLTMPDEQLPKVTASYSIEMPNFSNIKQSSTENAAIYNIDKRIQIEKFMKRFSICLNKLTKIERQLIVMMYMTHEASYIYEICEALRVSKSKFYRLKSTALYKLALSTGVVVYADEVQP
ncbi:ArpU family phage packaging/lysis transcriptional regulator [Viridibacillus arvi]|uniref:ArpU family phage packaging/lysis transcriptional regulator n=1 Tax=Viridibacillus arvi TaxID=263475 RepID=UPI0034CEF13A